MSNAVYQNSIWECKPTDKDYCERVAPLIPITKNQKVQWDIFNKLPLTIDQKQRIAKELSRRGNTKKKL